MTFLGDKICRFEDIQILTIHMKWKRACDHVQSSVLVLKLLRSFSNTVNSSINRLRSVVWIVLHTFRFIEWYRQKLEPAAPYMEVDIDDRAIEVSALLGACSGFYTLLRHYERQLKTTYNDSLETLIAENFPLLSAGLAGSAVHGLIHLGYGYAAKNSRYQFCGVFLCLLVLCTVW